MQTQQENRKLGGLGANIGGEQWEKAQQKKIAAQKYAEAVRMNVAANPLPKKNKANAPRERTAREKALEFAKHVPKPKLSRGLDSQADQSDMQY